MQIGTMFPFHDGIVSLQTLLHMECLDYGQALFFHNFKWPVQHDRPLRIYRDEDAWRMIISGTSPCRCYIGIRLTSKMENFTFWFDSQVNMSFMQTDAQALILKKYQLEIFEMCFNVEMGPNLARPKLTPGPTENKRLTQLWLGFFDPNQRDFFSPAG